MMKAMAENLYHENSYQSPRCLLQLEPGRSIYDIHTEGRVMLNGKYERGLSNNYPTIISCIDPTVNTMLDVKGVHFYRESVYGRFIDPYLSSMWLNAGCGDQVDVIHIMPIWGYVLKTQMFGTSDQVRCAEMKYDLHENKITLYPPPHVEFRIFFEVKFIN